MSPQSTAQSEGSVTDNQGYPLGYMITFRCYGTWLHGDSRGAMDRRNHNCPGDPLMPADARLWASRRAALTQAPMQLDAAQRGLVAETIGAVCCYRNWQLHAAEVRTEHVHVVVSGECRPEAIMTTLKAWCTRRLREAGLLAAVRNHRPGTGRIPHRPAGPWVQHMGVADAVLLHKSSGIVGELGLSRPTPKRRNSRRRVGLCD